MKFIERIAAGRSMEWVLSCIKFYLLISMRLLMLPSNIKGEPKISGTEMKCLSGDEKMITLEKLISIDKNDLEDASKTIDKNDLPLIIDWLSEKNDKIRYHALLLLQNRSLYYDDVYPFWERFVEKLKSENSYQRSIGLMLIAENARWDKVNKFDDIKDEYFAILNDEKPITIRQCIQSFSKIIPYKIHLHMEIANEIIAIDITEIKETMQKLILIDMLSILALIRKYQTNEDIENYIYHALTGGLLDKKSIKQVESML